MQTTLPLASIRTAEVMFDAERQAYVMPAQSDLRFRRCSDLVESFFEAFDGPAIAQKLVTTHPKYAGRTAQELLDEWDAASIAGTHVHSEIQRYIQTGVKPTAPKAEHAVAWLDKNYPSADYLRESEVIVFDASIGLAGTLDLLVHPRGGGSVVLIDWKTNKKIDMVPFRDKRGILGPAKKWPDCHHFKYSLQLSIYRTLLESRCKLNFDEQKIVHLTDDGANPIPCDHHPKYVKNMIEHDAKTAKGAA